MHRITLLAIALSATATSAAAVDFEYAPWKKVGPTVWGEAVDVGDVTGDGRADVVLMTTSTTDVYVYVQQPDRTLASGVPRSYGLFTSSGDVELADLNGDGIDDIIVGRNDGLSILLATGGGGFTLQTIAAPRGSVSLATLDIDLDGHLDIAGLSHGDGLTLFYGDGQGGIRTQAALATQAAGFNDLEAGDVNGDGFTDLVVLSGQVYAVPDYSVHLHDGLGSLGAAQSFDFTTSNKGGLGLGDIDSDGRMDIVASGTGSPPTLWVLAQDPAGFFGPPLSLATYASPSAIEVGDVDANGRDDVVALHSAANNLGLYRQDASGLAAEVLSPLPYSSFSPRSLALGDINHDGCTDAAVSSYNDGFVYLIGTHCQYTPSVFTFEDRVDVARNTLFQSNSVQLDGLSSATIVRVSGGTYSVNGGAFTAATGVVLPGDSVRVAHQSANGYATSTSTTLVVGDASDNFTTTTVAADTVPDAFAFVDRSDVPRGTTQISNDIVVSGINAPTPISATGWYSIDGGSFMMQSGTVTNGQRVRVMHVSSGSFATSVNTTVTIGGVSDTFTSTTAARDVSPDAFAFAARTGVARSTIQTSDPITVSGINDFVSISIVGGTFAIDNGPYIQGPSNVVAGNVVRVRHTSAATFSTTTQSTLTIGDASATFRSTTLAADHTPDPFAFASVIDVPRGTLVTSAAATITGIDAGAPISVANGAYSIDGGPFVSTAGTVNAGQQVRVQHLSSPTFADQMQSTVTIGGTSASFASTTLARDVDPDAFAFAGIDGVLRSTVVTSAPISVAGINDAAAVSVVGGEYSVNGGAFTSAAGAVAAGDSVRVRHTSSDAFSTAVDTTLTIGGSAATFTSTTLARDTTPDAFAFADVSGVERSTVITSAEITVAGINDAAPISIANGTYSVDGGAFTNAAGTVQAGQRVRVRHTSAGAFATATSTTLTIGGVSDTFSSTTRAADATPNAFAFVDLGGVKRSRLFTSNTIVVSGIEVPVAITIAGGGGAQYSKNGGAWTSAAGTVSSGDTVALRVTSSSSQFTTVNATLTIGGVADVWSVTTGR